MLMASLSTLLAPMFTRLKNHPTKNDADGQLLQAFARTGSEAAFEELVRRHGSLVLSVCRRMLTNHHDAEDAFQATWIVLARKAHTIHRPEHLAQWLFGVARHAALNVRKIRLRRNNREQALGESTDVADHRATSWNETRPLLDDEVACLPEKYRLPLLLCCLQGYSHQEAAQHLAWPIGTVAGRLSRGKMLLKKRLLRRGIVVSPSVLSLCLTQDALAAIPSDTLVASTLGQLFAGSTVGLGGVVPSPALLAIAQGVISDLFRTRIMQAVIIISGVTLACAGMGIGLLAITRDSTSTQQTHLASPIAPLPVGNPRYVQLPADPQAVVLRMSQIDAEGNKPEMELVIQADGRIRGTLYDTGLESLVPLEERLSPQELQALMQFAVHDQQVFTLNAPATWKKLKKDYHFEGDLRSPTDTLLTTLEVRTADQQLQLSWSQLASTEAWFHDEPEVRRLMALYRKLHHQLVFMHAGGEARVGPVVRALNETLKKTYPRMTDLECRHLVQFTPGKEGLPDRWVFTRGNTFHDTDHFSVNCDVDHKGQVSLNTIALGQSFKRPTMKRRETPRPPS